MAECLFCAIVAGEIPATKVLETDLILAFRDINPQAPTHVLVVRRRTTPTWRHSPRRTPRCSVR